VVQVGSDLSELLVDLLRIGVVAKNSGEGSSSLFISSFHEEVSRRFGQDGETDDEDSAPL